MPGQPLGDVACVLEVYAPLTVDGHLDRTASPGLLDYCRITLTREGRTQWTSGLMRSDQGWVLRPGGAEESAAWQLDTHVVRPGEHATLLASDGQEFTFRFVNVEQL
jgi:hypothetical protein